MSFRALDHRFGLDADGWVGRFLREALVHLAVDEPVDGAPSYRVRRETGELTVSGPRVTGRTAAPTPALATLMTSINTAAIASVEGDGPVVHASAAAIGGRAIVVTGHPGAGKSTLVAGLVVAGADYLTDEAVPLTEEGLARPYPKPIVVGRGSWAALDAARDARVDPVEVDLDAWYLDPARLGRTVIDRPIPVGLVVLPRFVAGSPTLIEEVSPAEGAAGLASNSFNLSRLGAGAVDRCAEVAKAARCVRVTHGDLAQVSRQLVELAR